MPFYLPNTGGGSGGVELTLPFRGDWQNPADTLLWSTDFNDSGIILNDFEYSQIGSATSAFCNGSSITNTPSLERPPYETCASFGASTTSASTGTYFWRIKESVFPVGSTPTRITAWITNTQTNAAQHVGLGSTASGVGQTGAGICTIAERLQPFEWREISFTAESNHQVGFFAGDWGGSSNQSHPRGYITGVRVYGVVSADDIYQINDVVIHNDHGYRSLYSDNTEEPGSGSQWIEFDLPI